jgi:polyvinyl alcohol dehydrogenase (cytochrome)
MKVSSKFNAALIAAAALVSNVADAEDWPFYGHDLSNTFSAQTSVTTLTVGGLRLRWAYDTGEDVTSTPVAVGQVVYAAGWSGGVYALDRDTGALIWRYQLDPRRGERSRLCIRLRRYPARPGRRERCSPVED